VKKTFKLFGAGLCCAGLLVASSVQASLLITFNNSGSATSFDGLKTTTLTSGTVKDGGPENRGRNPASRVMAEMGQTVRAAALAVQFLFALQWPPLHEVWVSPSIVFAEVRHSTPKPEMESGETPIP
jgi:hypothetical protein